jgi:hypothetical protein
VDTGRAPPPQVVAAAQAYSRRQALPVVRFTARWRSCEEADALIARSLILREETGLPFRAPAAARSPAAHGERSARDHCRGDGSRRPIGWTVPRCGGLVRCPGSGRCPICDVYLYRNDLTFDDPAPDMAVSRPDYAYPGLARAPATSSSITQHDAIWWTLTSTTWSLAALARPLGLFENKVVRPHLREQRRDRRPSSSPRTDRLPLVRRSCRRNATRKVVQKRTGRCLLRRSGEEEKDGRRIIFDEDLSGFVLRPRWPFEVHRVRAMRRPPGSLADVSCR